MTDIINEFYKDTAWLYVKIYENSFFFFDYWSIVHIISGILIIIFFFYFNVKHKLINLFAILLGWEILEIAFLYFALNIFKPETFKDQFFDIIIGFLAGYSTKMIVENKPKFPFIQHLTKEIISITITSFIIAFFWVGFYQYHYNVDELNAPGFNLWAFLLWYLGLNGTLLFFSFIRKKIGSLPLNIIITWFSYFVVLLVVEYLGRYVIQIRESSNPKNTPLIFGLIYGNNILHIVYTIMPLIAILIYLLTHKIFTQIENIQMLLLNNKITNKEKIIMKN
ncbi:MAG: hypothetical protein ACPL1A_06035 [Candidatus Kapaibacteriota bacterium]